MRQKRRTNRGDDNSDNSEALIEIGDTSGEPWCPNPIDKLTDKQFCDMKRLARLGFNQRNIASWLMIKEQTFSDMLNQSPELRFILDNARANAVGKVAEVCYGMAMKGDINAIKLFLTHVGRWQVGAETTNNTINMQVNNILEQVPIDDVARLLRAKKVDNGASDT
jgi:hypothetical protein